MLLYESFDNINWAGADAVKLEKVECARLFGERSTRQSSEPERSRLWKRTGPHMSTGITLHGVSTGITLHGVSTGTALHDVSTGTALAL